MMGEDREHAGRSEGETMSASALTRRHALLKGLGKGAAVIGVGVPLQTLASQSVFTNPGKGGAPVIRCGISGMTSGVHSRDTVTSVCSGYSPGRYKNRENWPRNTNPDALCSALFRRCRLTMPATSGYGQRPATLLEVMNNYSSSDEFHWITAWLNAMGGAPRSWNFPYTGQQVVNLYNGTGPYPAGRALDFFKTYMEKHA